MSRTRDFKKIRSARELLARIFGRVCMIFDLRLREKIKERKERRAKKQKNKKIDEYEGNGSLTTLTYHHIAECSLIIENKYKEPTIENGALLSEKNHDWFNHQTPEDKAFMDEEMQKEKIKKLKEIDILNKFGYFATPSQDLLKSKEKENDKYRGNKNQRQILKLDKEIKKRSTQIGRLEKKGTRRARKEANKLKEEIRGLTEERAELIIQEGQTTDRETIFNDKNKDFKSYLRKNHIDNEEPVVVEEKGQYEMAVDERKCCKIPVYHGEDATEEEKNKYEAEVDEILKPDVDVER